MADNNNPAFSSAFRTLSPKEQQAYFKDANARQQMEIAQESKDFETIIEQGKI